jgi:hypothetical protein
MVNINKKENNIMNDVQKFILNRAMQKVANKGIQKEANPFAKAYDATTDWLANAMLNVPLGISGATWKERITTPKNITGHGYYTPEDPSKPFSGSTPVIEFAKNKDDVRAEDKGVHFPNWPMQNEDDMGWIGEAPLSFYKYKPHELYTPTTWNGIPVNGLTEKGEIVEADRARMFREGLTDDRLIPRIASNMRYSKSK